MLEETCSVDRAVWAALQDQRPTTLDELSMITGCDPAECLVYLNLLLRHQYVSIMGARQAASGEALPLFKLTKATGPEAPYGDEDGTFCDPNLVKPTKRRRGLRHQPMGELPTMLGRIRCAAYRLGNPFTRSDILENIPKERHEFFPRGWARLVWSGDLVPIMADEESGGLWELHVHPAVLPIRDWCREHLGQTIDARAIKADGVELPRGPFIRVACDMLAAEGFTITEQQGRKSKTYRVDAPQEEGI